MIGWDEARGKSYIDDRAWCALIQHFLHVPRPEDLSDEDFMEHIARLEFLSEHDLINMKLK